MAKITFLCVLFLFFEVSSARAQISDTIYLLNGQIFNGEVKDTSASISILDSKNKLLTYDNDQLYKINFHNNFTRFYYTYDTLTGNWLSREEMWMYMKGEKDARKGFKARGALIGSTVAGILGGLTGTFWGPVLPYGFMVLSGIPKIRIDHKTVSDTTNLSSEGYLMGYERVARQKLKIKSLIGGTAGLAVGYGVYLILTRNP